ATAYTSDWATVIANAQPKAGGNDNEYEMTVYAGWDINEYTLTFDSQGGTQIPAITQDYNTDITAPADPTKEGYTFTGWTPAIPAKMPARDTTVVAGWQLEGYTIHFDSKGGSAVADISRAYGLAISAPANPTKTGYDFIGWYTDTDCTVGNEFTFPETMPDLGANGAEIILYAKWSTNQYTITFDSKGGSAVAPITQDYNTEVTAPAAPTKTGYDFAGWYTDAEYTGNEYTFSTMPAQSFILYAKWQVKQYTITFDSMGGSAVAAITQDYNTAVSAPAAPTRTGYDFIGWYTDENCTDGNEYTFSTMPAESFILYAKWQIKQYTISFDSKGGSAVASITQDYNTAVTAPADPTRTGYTFDKSNGTSGWYTDPNCTAGTEYVFSTMPAQNINLYAKWTVAQYTITILDGIDNSIVIDTITQDYDTNVSPTEPTRTGYTFGGYYEEAALLNQYTFSKMPAENINVYVKWNAIEIRVDFLEPDASYNPADSAHNTLTFNDKAVFNNISSYYVDFNDTLSEVPSGNPDPDYYTFIGWSETEGGAVIENISAWVINEANFDLVQTVGGEKVVYLYPVFEREDVTLEVEVVEDGPVIVTASGEGINGYIYNAGSKLTKTALASELRVIGNGTLIITASKGKYCGTGTKIELKDNVTEQIVEVYYVIVCGDLNGDANCNAVDHGIAERRVNEGETNNKVSAEINHCYDLAGDVNGDGLFNSDDTVAIEAYLFHDVSYDFNTNIGKYVVVPKNA
ncbi:MAG: InlB B-repeat-containing protein, partial [Clostridia bacterium]|nr:InlB B-repeat-containing protein [Clostridia bacterium]